MLILASYCSPVPKKFAAGFAEEVWEKGKKSAINDYLRRRRVKKEEMTFDWRLMTAF